MHYALARQHFDVVARTRVVREPQDAREAVQAVAHSDVDRLAKDAVAARHGERVSSATTPDSSNAHELTYHCIEYAMTCVLPPLTYSTTGSDDLVTVRPISMSAQTACSELAIASQPSTRAHISEEHKDVRPTQ